MVNGPCLACRTTGSTLLGGQRLYRAGKRTDGGQVGAEACRPGISEEVEGGRTCCPGQREEEGVQVGSAVAVGCP